MALTKEVVWGSIVAMTCIAIGAKWIENRYELDVLKKRTDLRIKEASMYRDVIVPRDVWEATRGLEKPSWIDEKPRKP
eukprot:ANDGO_07078.mRNA.1 hypothetical protein